MDTTLNHDCNQSEDYSSLCILYTPQRNLMKPFRLKPTYIQLISNTALIFTRDFLIGKNTPKNSDFHRKKKHPNFSNND